MTRNATLYRRLQRVGSAVFAIALVAALAAPAEAQSRKWSASGSGKKIAATDCTDCGDDIGMMISCIENGEFGEVIVQWAASDKGADNTQIALGIKVDDQVFDRNANTKLFGQIGYTPQFYITADDPLLEALMKGRSVTFNHGGKSTSIALTGSGAALERFKAGCGWR